MSSSTVDPDPAGFRRLVALRRGEPVRRFVLAAPPEASAGAFVSVAAEDGDILLNVERHAGALVAAQRLGGEWTGRVEQPAEPALDTLTLILTPDEVALGLPGGAEIRWPTPQASARAARLDALGPWRLLEQDAPAASAGTEGRVASGAPPRGLAGTLQPDLIFDIGANNGDDAAFYLAKGFRVVAVDADPTLCARLAGRFADAIAAGRLTLLNVGVAPTRGRMTFYVNQNHDEWSSFDREIASRGHPVEEVVVPTVTTEDLFDAFGVPHFLKIDIEGYDHVPVQAVVAHPAKPPFLSFENGALPLFEALAGAGYDRFQLVNQAKVPEMRCPEPAREGRTVAHPFPMGSSGPFGRDLPEEGWTEAEAMRETLRAHHRRVAEAPDSVTGEWFDLHAARST